MDTEDLYISLYEGFSPTAEYLQADSPHRNLLAEGLIIAGLSFALKAFAEAFFEKLGESAADATVSGIKRLFKQSESTGDRQALLDGLALMAPYLPHLGAMNATQRAVYQAAVADALSTRGYPKAVADQTAAELMGKLQTGGA